MHGTPPAKLRARLLFDDLANPTERSVLLDDARTIRYQPRQLICDEGSPSEAMFVIVEGRVELFLRRGNGNQDIYLDEQGPGEYFGELGLFDGRSRSASAIATLPTTCKLIDKESLRTWLVAHPRSALALLTHSSLRIRDLTDELRASMSSAYERVARFIEQVAVLEPSSGERIVHAMPATSHIARMLGISRERTSNILNALTRGGYIESRGRSLLLRRPLPESY
jgi:CRP/FNR family cyclic AMP-dependent transcriptional regulator